LEFGLIGAVTEEYYFYNSFMLLQQLSGCSGGFNLKMILF